VPNEDFFEFDTIVRYTVNFDGTWSLDTASFGKYTRKKLDDVWAGRFVDSGIDREVSAPDEKTRSEFSRNLAKYIMGWQCWDPSEGSTWTIKKT
jgi:hypothetical protein